MCRYSLFFKFFQTETPTSHRQSKLVLLRETRSVERQDCVATFFSISSASPSAKSWLRQCTQVPITPKTVKSKSLPQHSFNKTFIKQNFISFPKHSNLPQTCHCVEPFVWLEHVYQNCRQNICDTVFCGSAGKLCVCEGGLNIPKIDKIPLIYTVSRFNLEGQSPAKLPLGDGTDLYSGYLPWIGWSTVVHFNGIAQFNTFVQNK